MMDNYQKEFMKAARKPNFRRFELITRKRGLLEFAIEHYIVPLLIKKRQYFMVYDDLSNPRFFIKRRLAKAYYKKLLNIGKGDIVFVGIKKKKSIFVRFIMATAAKNEKVTIRVVGQNEMLGASYGDK